RDRRERRRLILDVRLVARFDPGGRLGRLRKIADLLDALLGLGMRREESVALGLRLVPLFEPRQKVGQRGRGVSQLRRRFNGELVGVELVAPVVGVLENVIVGSACDLRDELRAARRGLRTHLDRGVLLDRVDRVLADDVPDLVTEDGREFRFVLNQPERAAGDVDEAAGRGKRVDAVGIEHDEGPRELRPFALLSDGHPGQRHVLMNGWILDDTKSLPDLQADILAKFGFFLFGEGQVVHLLHDVLGLLRLLHRAADAAQLGPGRRGHCQEHYENESVFHVCASFVTLVTVATGEFLWSSAPSGVPTGCSPSRPISSKMETGLVLPLTITSPSGFSTYCFFSCAFVNSLMIILVPYCLLSDSSREPRFTASPMTV